MTQATKDKLLVTANLREKLSSRDTGRISFTIQNQHATALVKVSNKQTGAAIILMPYQFLIRDIFTPTDEIWVESDTANTMVALVEEYR